MNINEIMALFNHLICYICGVQVALSRPLEATTCDNCKKHFCWSCSRTTRIKNLDMPDDQLFTLKECVHCTLDFEKLIITSDDVIKYLKDQNEYDALPEKVKMSKYQNNLKGTGRLTKPALSQTPKKHDMIL